MASRISCFLYNRQVIDMLRRGVETEHFRARVSWPNGFDGEPKIVVSMNYCEFHADEWGSAEDAMHETLTDELNDLYSRVHDLTHTIGIFAVDRELIREHKNPNVIGRSCFSGVYEKMTGA